MQQCHDCGIFNSYSVNFCTECGCDLSSKKEYTFKRCEQGRASCNELDLFININQLYMTKTIFAQGFRVQALVGDMRDFFISLNRRGMPREIIETDPWRPQPGAERIMQTNFEPKRSGTFVLSLVVGFRRKDKEYVYEAQFQPRIIPEHQEKAQLINELKITYSDSIRVGYADKGIQVNKNVGNLKEIVDSLQTSMYFNEIF